MLILAVESSCDETAVALVRDGREIVTDQIFSQAALHAVYGGGKEIISFFYSISK